MAVRHKSGFQLFALTLLAGISAVAESHSSFVLKDVAVGSSIGNYTENGSYIMPNVIRADDGSYVMYFTNNGPTHTEIVRATSSDAIDWTVTGTALSGVDDTTDREFRIGGASVVKLKSGKFRMYYRAAQENEHNSPPKYHILSAISDDGITFTREAGVRIENVFYDPKSPFLLAAHGTFFRAKNGLFVGIFSANTLKDRGPSDLVLTTSRDGLKWGQFRTLYKDCHDPVVVYTDGKFHLYTMLTNKRDMHGASIDGIHWPKRMSDFEIVDQQGNSLDPTTDAGAGDFGAVATVDGKILFYSNFGNPSRDIVVYEEAE